MTNEFNSLFDSVKQAFAPMTEALKILQPTDVAASAREFVQKTVSTARDRAAEAFAEGEKATAAIETAVAGGVGEAVKMGRGIQDAIRQDAEAFLNGIEKLAAAGSVGEAVQIQSGLMRAQGEVVLSRAKAASDYVGKLVTEGAKTVQDNFAKAAGTSI